MIAVAIATAFLNAGGGAFNNTWRIVYGPLLSVPLAVAKEVNGAGSGSNCAVAVDVGADVEAAEQSLKAMEGVVCDSNAISMKGIAFGMALATSGSGNGFVAGILNALCGLIVMAVFFYVTITFPMRFIDVLVRLAVIGVLTPVLIVCATFKQSRAYVQIAVSNILYCGSVFAFTSILFGLGIRFFEQRMDAHINAMPTSSNTTIIGSSFEIIAMALIFASFSRTALSLAQEFSQFRGSAGGAGDAATNFSNLIVSSGVKGGTAGSTGAIQSLATAIKKRGGGVSGGAEASQVGGGSASGSLGRGVSS